MCFVVQSRAVLGRSRPVLGPVISASKLRQNTSTGSYSMRNGSYSIVTPGISLPLVKLGQFRPDGRRGLWHWRKTLFCNLAQLIWQRTMSCRWQRFCKLKRRSYSAKLKKPVSMEGVVFKLVATDHTDWSDATRLFLDARRWWYKQIGPWPFAHCVGVSRAWQDLACWIRAGYTTCMYTPLSESRSGLGGS